MKVTPVLTLVVSSTAGHIIVCERLHCMSERRDRWMDGSMTEKDKNIFSLFMLRLFDCLILIYNE